MSDLLDIRPVADPIAVPAELKQEAPDIVGVARTANEKSFWDFKWVKGVMGLIQGKNNEVIPLGNELVSFWETGEPGKLVEDINRSYLKSGDVEVSGRDEQRGDLFSLGALWNRISDSIKKLTESENQSESRKASVKFLREGAEKTKKATSTQKVLTYATLVALPFVTLGIAGTAPIGLAFTGITALFSTLGAYQFNGYMKRKDWLTKATNLTADMIEKTTIGATK